MGHFFLIKIGLLIAAIFFVPKAALAKKPAAKTLKKSKVKGKAKAKTKVKKRVKAKIGKKAAALKAAAEFDRLYEMYQKNVMKEKPLWIKLVEIEPKLDNKRQIKLLTLKADLLEKEKLYVLSAVYASRAIKKIKQISSDDAQKSFAALHRLSQKIPIQFLLEDIALSGNLKSKIPPHFGNDWNYIVANAHNAKGKKKNAYSYYKRVNHASRYYMPSRYQMAMIDFSAGKFKAAKAALGAILTGTARNISPLAMKDKDQMWDYANMALGRIHYQQKKFLTAARYFRRVHKKSPVYYDALFEQSWALFMSGNPQHALGSLYGSSSSFFEDIYNPEVKVLESIIYFWMCRYDDSRNSLADFAESYSKSVSSLGKFLSGKSLTPQSAYTMFENLVAGVSSRSLGVPREVLRSAATRDTMLLVRDQLATVMVEADRVKKRGIFGNFTGIDAPYKIITDIQKTLKRHLGEKFILELKAEKEHYEDLHSQAQFLYLELIMSEKEQILGRELHGASKVDRVADASSIRGWGRNTQSWMAEAKGEYWWDELGFHIVNVEPRCVARK